MTPKVKMPKKTGKKGKDGKEKGKKGANKKLKGRNDTADAIIQRLLKCYEKNCLYTNSRMSPGIRHSLNSCIEDSILIVKFILQSVTLESDEDLPVLFEPFLASIRQERYTFIKDLHIWDYPMSYENVASLALMMEKPFYPLRLLEMMDCLVTAAQLQRLARAMPLNTSLTHLMLDYNEFGDEGCHHLCKGLSDNITLLSLSLCYCDLGVESGKLLGDLVSSTAIRDLFLDGNSLECEGAMELIKLFSDMAENEAFEREEAERRKAELEAEKAAKAKEGKRSYMSGSRSGSGPESGPDIDEALTPPGSAKKKKKKKGKKKKKEPPGPPRVGPWISKLHLTDNGIDGMGKGSNFAPVICIRLFSTLIMNAESLQELDLDDNLIGDLAGREIQDALEKRKETKLPSIKVRVTHRLNPDTFSGIIKLGAGLKKKKKKKGKKKKKK